MIPVKNHFRRPAVRGSKSFKQRLAEHRMMSEADRKEEESVDPPIPLRQPCEPGLPYPVDALGSLAPAVRQLQAQTKAPLTLCATTVLMAVNTVTHRIFDVALPFPGNPIKPTSLFACTIGQSGLGKSTVEGIAFKAVREHEAMTDTVMMTDQYTIHGLEDDFEQTDALALVIDEGSLFINDRRLNEAWISKRWDGAAIKRRQRNKKIDLKNKRLAISILVQTDVAHRFLSDPKLSGQGILSRFLVAEPEPTIGKREIPLAGINDAGDMVLWSFDVHLRSLLLRQAGRTTITFSPDASRATIEFLNSHDRRLGPVGDLTAQVDLVNKIPEMACRIASTLAGWNGEAEVSLEVMEQAIEIARFHLHEIVRIDKHERFDPVTVDAENVLEWIRKYYPSGEPFSLVDVYLHGPLRGRDKKHWHKVMNKLIDYRHVERVELGREDKPITSEFDGKKRRKDIYRLRVFSPPAKLEFEAPASTAEPSPASPPKSRVELSDEELAAIDAVLAED